LVVASGDLESVDVRGGKPKRIGFDCSLSPCVPQGFVLSPNREYAAVTTQDGNPHSPDSIELVRMKPARHAVVLRMQISGEAFDRVLAFSPDSRQLVYWHCQGMGPPSLYGCSPYALMAVRIPGGTPVPLAQSGIPGAGLVPSDVQQVRWSRGGRWLAFIENGSLEVAPTSGASAPRVLATCVAPNVLSDFSWSPTSKLIAYDCVDGESGGGQILTVRPDGTHRTDLLKGRTWAWVGDYKGEPVPQWSPDGSRLLILASQAYTATTHVFTIRPNGHSLTRLG
jgi:Tol biopolymer transport system component